MPWLLAVTPSRFLSETGVADAALFAFVLFHLSDPSEALSQAARVLRVVRVVGTATWARSRDLSPAAYRV